MQTEVRTHEFTVQPSTYRDALSHTYEQRILECLGSRCAKRVKQNRSDTGINIKGRVNIINNLRYNGPSGAGNKFVDTRWGKVERDSRCGKQTRARGMILRRGRRLAVRETGKQQREKERGTTFLVDIIKQRRNFLAERNGQKKRKK